MDNILVIGLNRNTAPVKFRQKNLFADRSASEFFEKLFALPSINEHLILSTGNRTEIFLTAPDAEHAFHALAGFLAGVYETEPEELTKYLFVKENREAVRYVFRVCAGMDSMVVREPRVHDQVRRAFEQAIQLGSARAILSDLFQKAFSVINRLESETMVGDRSRSISRVSVELAVKIFADLKDKALLIIGEGRLCHLIAAQFRNHPLSDIVVTYPQNMQPCGLDENGEMTVMPFAQLNDALGSADIIISSTSLPDFVIHYSDITRIIKTRRHRSMFFIDIGVPEDIDERVNSIDNVYVYDFIDLQNMADKQDVEKAEDIIAEEAEAFLERFRKSRTGPTQAHSHEKLTDVSAKETPKFSGYEDPDRGVVGALASAFIRKFKKLVIGTRKSKLALWQAEWVKARLEREYAPIRVELKTITTSGDMILDPLNEVGGKGLFLKQIERALLDGRVDLAVHSTKDVPVLLAPGLTIPCFTKREDPRDALISKRGHRLADLPHNARIGTCSLRRQSQLLHHRPDLEIVPLRGNVDTRIKKLETQELDGIILAVSGLQRQGLSDWITEILPVAICLPAVGQGALAIETRQDDTRTSEFVSCLNDEETFLAVSAERGFLKRLGGGCQSPVAAHAVLGREGIVVDGMIASVDGREIIRDRKQGDREDAETLGEALAETILARGGHRILEAISSQQPTPGSFPPPRKTC